MFEVDIRDYYLKYIDFIFDSNYRTIIVRFTYKHHIEWRNLIRTMFKKKIYTVSLSEFYNLNEHLKDKIIQDYTYKSKIESLIDYDYTY